MTSSCSATRSPPRDWRRASRSLKASSLLRLAIEDLYPGRIALVSSFGADAAALLHMVSRIDAATPVIFVDTGQHFPETLAYRAELCERLKLANVTVATPNPEVLAAEDPEKFLFASDPDRCCEIRKVRPLAEAMEGFDAWITGRKGFQSETRATLPVVRGGGRADQDQSAGWLERERRAGLYRGSWPAAPPSGRQGFSIDRLPAVHEPGQAGRRRAGRPLARARQGGMRHSYRAARRGARHLMALWRREGFAEDCVDRPRR